MTRQLGAPIVLRGLEEPIRHIASNSGHDGAVIADEVKAREGAVGFNANTGEYVDLFKAGIVDPTKVTRSALQNAASIAALMLTTEADDHQHQGRRERGCGPRRRFGPLRSNGSRRSPGPCPPTLGWAWPRGRFSVDRRPPRMLRHIPDHHSSLFIPASQLTLGVEVGRNWAVSRPGPR